MTNQEFAELLQFTQAQMREHGLSSLNDRIVSDLQMEPGTPSSQFLRYLDALESELRLGTDSTYRSIVERFRATIQTESGRPVEGVELVLSESDRNLFGTDAVDLGVNADLEAIVHDVAQLRSEIQESLDTG